MNWLARTRIAFGLTLAALFLVIGPGCAGGGFEGGHTSCGRSGGSSTSPRVPLSRYVGTWKGSWTTVNINFPEEAPPKGEMTLTVDPTGAFSGQLTDTATNRTGSVSGKIMADGESGTADFTTTFGERSEKSFTLIVILQTNGHLDGSMRVPVGLSFTSTLASFDLTRQ